MERPSRKTKAVNYSDLMDLGDDDDDFTSVKAPPSKKARENVKEYEQVKSKKSSSRSTSQESDSQLVCPKDRTPLGDKLYERDLQAALTLSLLQKGEMDAEQCTENKDVKDQPQRDADLLRLSNCSVDINLLGLDRITNEQGSRCAPSRRRKAKEQQRGVLKDDDDYQPGGTPDSESDASLSGQGESDEEEFTVKKAEKKKLDKTKTNKKKTLKQPPVLKKENIVMLISKRDDGEFAVQNTRTNKKECTEEPPALMKEEPPAIMKEEPPAIMKEEPPALKKEEPLALMKEEPPAKAKVGHTRQVRSPAASRPASVPRRPPATPPASRPAVPLSLAGGRAPRWTPPAQVGRSSGPSQSPSQVKSPGQGLRLGLSRLARVVKPLHPSVAGH